MPTLADNLSLTAGSVSINPFEGTNYAQVAPGTVIRINLASVSTNDGVSGANLNYRFVINNTEFATGVAIPSLVSGQAFGDNGAYLVNSVEAQGANLNTPLLTISNSTSGTLVAKYFIFISQQP
jgi:hypothetical protein